MELSNELMGSKKSEQIILAIGGDHTEQPLARSTVLRILGLKNHDLPEFFQFLIYCCGVFFFFLLYGYYQVIDLRYDENKIIT